MIQKREKIVSIKKVCLKAISFSEAATRHKRGSFLSFCLKVTLNNGNCVFLIACKDVKRQKQPKVFYKKAVLKNIAIFTGKHLCWSLFFIKLQACFEEYHLTAASEETSRWCPKLIVDALRN